MGIVMTDRLKVTKESYKHRVVNLMNLAVLELDEEAKEVIEAIRDKCNEILNKLKPEEE